MTIEDELRILAKEIPQKEWDALNRVDRGSRGGIVMGRYDYHAENLIRILEDPNTCERCPTSSCADCNDFLELDVGRDRRLCPCHFLGPEEAAKRTWIRLEELGYI